MKAMTKSELADCAGVTVKTLMSWCVPYSRQLSDMGMAPKAKVLPPHIVSFLAEKLCIDLNPYPDAKRK